MLADTQKHAKDDEDDHAHDASDEDALSDRVGAVNLSQGFPDFDVSPALIDRVVHYMRTGCNQYAPMTGVPSLREAIAAKTAALYDAAYESFIQDADLPRSIYEVEGARKVAIEFRSFSKTAGFTGTRCGFTVVPKECRAFTADGERHSLHDLWHRRHATKFNSVSYPVQRATEAVYSPEGRQQCRALIEYYLKNAALIRREISALGFECIGGENSPYIWIDGKRDSWEFFDRLLDKVPDDRDLTLISDQNADHARAVARHRQRTRIRHRAYRKL